MNYEWIDEETYSECLGPGNLRSVVDRAEIEGVYVIYVCDGWISHRDQRDTLDEAKARAEQIIREEFLG